MFNELKEMIENNYLIQRNAIIEKNILFLQKYSEEEYEEIEELDLNLKRVVIPFIDRIPRYRFYTHLDEVLPTKDDPVLRFVPYLPSKEEYEDLYLFEFSELGEKPLNKEMHINECLMREFLMSYSDFQLFKLKKLVDKKEDYEDLFWKEHPHFLEFERFTNISVKKLLNFWESIFDKRRTPLYVDESALDYYFCNVCYSFDCGIHDHYNESNIQIKKRNLPSTSNEIIHRNMCIETLSKKSKSEVEEILNTFKKEYKFITRNYDVDPCTAALFFYFCTGEKLPNHIFPKCKEKFFTKENKPSIIKRKTNLNFYYPCNHLGSCVNNPKCSCEQNKNMCEENCLCVNCDNLFTGCNCKTCNSKCKCRLSRRECASSCKCSECLNKFFTLKQYKKTYIGKSRISNYGLFAGEFIEKDSFICEYTGELIQNAEAERRGQYYEKRKVSYLFDVSSLNKISYHTLDAMYAGNNTRFANHSIKPNIMAQNFLVNGIRRIGFFAIVDILIHSELVFDYNYNEEHKKQHEIIE